MLLPRLLQPAQGPSTRRAYSFFSSKSGSGRYFNSARPTKPVTKPTTLAESATSQASALPTSKTTDGSAAQEEPVATPSTSLESLSPHAPFNSPPNFHPQPNVPTFHLHNFFSLHRPLLLLNQSPTALFEPVSSQPQPPTPSNFLANSAELEDDPEADINAARLLARSLVMQRVGSTMEWNAVESALGVRADVAEMSEEVVQLDSTKRKRQKKMTKHRYKKRRKLQRAERRRLGK